MESPLKWEIRLIGRSHHGHFYFHLFCEQFYATDGIKVWRGGVIIDAAKHEIIDMYSYHIFTSGVTPIMSLQLAFGEIGDTISLDNLYQNGFLKADYRDFEITDRADEFQLGHR